LLRTPGRVALEVGRLAVDAVPRPGRLPRTSGELDAATLGDLLGRPVDRVTVLDGTSGTTDRSRLALEGPGLPGSVFVKMAAADAGTRLFGGLARLGAVEIGFYRDLRPSLTIEAPRVLGARFDRPTGRFAIVLEDLTQRGATFVDTLTPLTPDRAAAALTTLARLHAGTAGVPVRPGWLGTNSGDALLPLVTAGLGRLGRRVVDKDPGLTARGGERILGTYRRWAPLLDRGPQCVLHGDPHPGNLYLVEDRVGFLDWQAVRRGNGLRDATYNLVLGLTIPDRRAHEHDLLAHYRQELAACGGPDLDADGVWESYRRMAAYAYVAAVFTYGLGGLQGDAIADAGLRRAIAAVDDLETAAVLG
jgi:Phosphotransferase enzyme family